jgi:ribose transport system ATP-binding protein
MAQLLLEMRGIEKHYGSVRALKGVDLAVDRGEILAVVGENGAGKSTIMRILAGIELADAGQVRIEGEPVELGSPSRALALGISLVPQELTLCLDLTVAENVLLGTFPTTGRGTLDTRALSALASDRLAAIGATGLSASAVVRDLGFVERALVQIARAIRDDTRVLIMDEPTAPMSQSEVDQLLSVLKSLSQRGVAVLYVSHRLEEIVHLADRAVVLRDGLAVAELPGEALTLESLVDAMVGEEGLTSDRQAKDRAVGDVLLDVRHATGTTLHDVSLDVSAGEIVAVYGVLGSGYEQLGSAIISAQVLPGGYVMVNGTDIAGTGVPGAVAAGLGYVPPERRAQGLHLAGSVADNLTLGMLSRLSRRGVIDTRAKRDVVQRLIRELSIKTPSAETPVLALSGGSQQKVLIARWLAAAATVLVLEEPTRGVDVQTKRELYDTLRARAAEGAAILVISSDLEEIVEIADRVLVVRAGQLAGTISEPERSAIASAALTPVS